MITFLSSRSVFIWTDPRDDEEYEVAKIVNGNLVFTRGYVWRQEWPEAVHEIKRIMARRAWEGLHAISSRCVHA